MTDKQVMVTFQYDIHSLVAVSAGEDSTIRVWAVDVAPLSERVASMEPPTSVSVSSTQAQVQKGSKRDQISEAADAKAIHDVSVIEGGRLIRTFSGMLPKLQLVGLFEFQIQNGFLTPFGVSQVTKAVYGAWICTRRPPCWCQVVQRQYHVLLFDILVQLTVVNVCHTGASDSSIRVWRLSVGHRDAGEVHGMLADLL